MVTKLDRLARSVGKAWEVVETLEAKGAGLRILSLGGDTVDTRRATGKLILTGIRRIRAVRTRNDARTSA